MSSSPSTSASGHDVARRLGEDLRRLRKLRRLSKAQLSLDLGLQVEELARIERGDLQMSLDTLATLLQELGPVRDQGVLGGIARPAGAP